MRKEYKQLKELKKYGQRHRLAAEKWDKPWKTLIATILSARTNDDVTIPVSIILFKKYPNLEKLSKAKNTQVKKIIKPVNFYITKSKRVVDCAKVIVIEYKGKIPNTIDELIKLPGVGRKTANVYLSELGHYAIGVDTHVAQLSYKLGWTKHKKPELIEADLKKLFPKEKWNEINVTLVTFGRTFPSKRKQDQILKDIVKIK